MPEIVHSHGVVFLMVLVRVSGLVLFVPGLQALSAPRWTRLLLPLALALLITPIHSPAAASGTGSMMDLVVPLCREAVLGLVMGVSLLAVVAGMQGAGSLLGQISGMSLAETAGPDSAVPSTLMAGLFRWLALVCFLVSGGHRHALAAILDSFRWMPPGQVGFATGLVATLTEVIAHSLELALRVAAPVALALMVTTIALALMQRALPQLNIMALGLGLNTAVALLAICLVLGALAWTFQDETDRTMARLQETLTNLPAAVR